jgi:arginine/lysine/ornithine decarboxylase
MARNGHKSSFAGLVLSGARPVYVDPYYDEQLELAHEVLVQELAKTLDAHPEAKAVMISTPSYYGSSGAVKAIADLCHERDLPLVTDDAWGWITSSPRIRSCRPEPSPKALTSRSARYTRRSQACHRRRCSR